MVNYWRAQESLPASCPSSGHAINLCRDRAAFVVGLLATIDRQHALLLPANRQQAALQVLDRRYANCYVLTDEELDSSVKKFHVACGDAVQKAVDTSVVDDQRVVARVFTSGSTGEPVAHEKRWCTWRVGSELNAHHLLSGLDNGGDRPYIIATVPSQHNYGLELAIEAAWFLDVCVYRGQPFYPLDVVAALRLCDAPRVLVTTPAHLRALLQSGIELPRVHRVLSATAPLSAKLATDMESACRGDVIETFGSTETGCFAWRRTSQETVWTLFDGFELEPGAQATIAASHLPERIQMQDVIEDVGGNKFVLRGRHSDLLNIAGKRASLAGLNQILLGIDGVVDGALFVTRDNRSQDIDRLAGLLVSERSPADVLNELREQIDPVFLPRPFLKVNHLPRAETGKLTAAALLECLRQRRIRDVEGPVSSDEC